MLETKSVARVATQHMRECIRIAEGLPEYFTQSALDALQQDLGRNTIWLAHEEQQIVGFACVLRKSSPVAEILWMAVEKDRRRRGVGSMLLDAASRELATAGVRLLMAKTLAPDVEYAPYEATRRFYEKKGFIHLETIDPYPGWDPGNPCAIYVRVL